MVGGWRERRHFDQSRKVAIVINELPGSCYVSCARDKLMDHIKIRLFEPASNTSTCIGRSADPRVLARAARGRIQSCECDLCRDLPDEPALQEASRQHDGISQRQLSMVAGL